MADNMMRIAGRDANSGTAKAIKTNENGALVIENPVPVDIQLHNISNNPLPVTQALQATYYRSRAVGGAVTVLDPAEIRTYTHAYITVEDAPIRYRIDGGEPTATEGHLLNPGDKLSINSHSDLNNFKAIRTTGTNGRILTTYSVPVNSGL